MADDDARARRTGKAAAGGPARKAAAKTATAGGPAKKAAVKKAGVKKAAVKKAAAPRKAPVKRTAAAPAKKTPAPRTTAREAGAILAPRKKAPPKLRLAAEETFDDDWKQPAPAPEPPRDDPGARLRARIRAAARSLEEREAAAVQPPRPVATPEPPAPQAPDEPVTRVLVAPVPPEPDADEEWGLEDDLEPDEALDEDVDETVEEEEEEEVDEDEDWAPPEVLDDTRPFAAPPAPPPSRPAGPTPPPPPIHRTPEAEVSVPPRPLAPEPPADKKTGGGGGLSVLAIVLALVGPVIGAVIGLVLAGRARARGSALAGPARAVSVLALVGWLVGAGVLGYVVLRDEGVDYSKLKVGDCFDSSQSNEIRGIEVEPCAESHNSEIFFIVTHPAGPGEPYPGKDTLVQFAADACLGQPLTDYLGVPLEQSQLKDFEIVPQESAWDDGRRVLLCGVDTGGQGDLTGSVKGTRR